MVQDAVSNFRQTNVQVVGVIDDEHPDARFVRLSVSWSAYLVLLD
jgi:hypothetical protein